MCQFSRRLWRGLVLMYTRALSRQHNIMLLALLAFEVTIYRHQELYRLRHKIVLPPTRSLFQDVTRQHLDDNMLSCVKYFLNYFFYKFGLEVRWMHTAGNKRTANWLTIDILHCFFFLDLLLAGYQRDWSAHGSFCCSPCFWPYYSLVTAQQKAHICTVAKILLLPVSFVVFPVRTVHWISSRCL